MLYEMACHTTLVIFSSALKLIFLCVPSHCGLFAETPHLHIAAKTFPSTTIRLGPSSVLRISTGFTIRTI